MSELRKTGAASLKKQIAKANTPKGNKLRQAIRELREKGYDFGHHEDGTIVVMPNSKRARFP